MSPILQSLANGSARGYGAFVPLGAAGAYESIASATGTGSSGTITFSSIPSTYQSLQIRYHFQSTVAGNPIYLRLNNDSGTNYTLHRLYGNGATVVAGGSVTQAQINISSQASGPTSTSPVVGIVDIHNYTSTTQNKTVRTICGIDANGSGDINLLSGLWINTAAVNRLDFIADSTNFSTSTTIALYGIKGA